MTSIKITLAACCAATIMPFALNASELKAVSDEVVAEQRDKLAMTTTGMGFGPQSPRDIDTLTGENSVSFNVAPDYQTMSLCDIHFHKNAEHKGGEFTKYAGNGNGEGYSSGYQFSGSLAVEETNGAEEGVCPSEHSVVYPGDTLEVHFVYSTAPSEPGPTLNTCFTDANVNPQLRVESQVLVAVTDPNAMDFTELTQFENKGGVYQAVNLPTDTGSPVQYAGSTTGPGYNEKGSPYQVSWGVRPKVAKVNIESVGKWCEGNVFKENHAHGVRNLVVNPKLLSNM